MRSPVNTAGSDAGTWSLTRRVYLSARCSVNRSCIAGSADCSPKNVFVMIGNTAMSTQTTTRLQKE